MSKRVLITGASGFVGANLARFSLEHGFHVVAHYHTKPPDLPPSPRLQVVQCDLRNQVPDWPKVDLVLHTATNANAPNVPASDLIEGNLILTKNLLSWMLSAGIPFCFFCSTVSIYGDFKETLLEETVAPINTGTYGMTKKLSEDMFQEHAERIACLSVRLPSVLGPNARGTWLTRLIDDIRSGRRVTVFNPDASFNNVTHVADLFNLALNVHERGHRGFDFVNVSAATALTIREVAALLFRELNMTPDLEVIERGRQSFSISCSKACELYGFDPMPIDIMLRRHVQELRLSQTA